MLLMGDRLRRSQGATTTPGARQSLLDALAPDAGDLALAAGS